jgi:hypothetical protein
MLLLYSLSKKMVLVVLEKEGHGKGKVWRKGSALYKVTPVILHGFVCEVTPAILHEVVCKVTPVILHGVASV